MSDFELYYIAGFIIKRCMVKRESTVCLNEKNRIPTKCN